MCRPLLLEIHTVSFLGVLCRYLEGRIGRGGIWYFRLKTMSEGSAPHRCVLCKDDRFAMPPLTLDIGDYAVLELLCYPFTGMHPSGEVFAAASAMDNEDKVDWTLDLFSVLLRDLVAL